MKMKHLALASLLAIGCLLTSCGKVIQFPEKQDPDLGLGVKTSETETESQAPSDPAKLVGNWYSYPNLLFYTFDQNGEVKQYRISPGYFEYYEVITGSYTYDGTDLKLVLDGNAYSFACSVSDNMTMEAGGQAVTYLPSEELPTEHVTYPFPDFAEIIKGIQVEVPTCTGLELKTETVQTLTRQVLKAVWMTQSDPTLQSGTAKEGDLVNIDFAGYRMTDGEKVYFDGGTAQGQMAFVADGTGYVNGFAAQIAGHSTEEGSFTIPVTFPENYSSELAGAEVFFEMKLNGLYPQPTDEMVKTYTDGTFETYEAYLNSVVKDALKNEVLDLIPKPELKEEEIPFNAYAFYLQFNTDRLHQMAFSYGMEYADILGYYGMDENSLKSACIDIARKELSIFLISRALDLRPTEEERTIYTEQMIATYLKSGYGSTREEAETYLRENAAELEDYVTSQYLMQYLVDHNTFLSK